MALNSIIIMGRLGKDPELRYTQAGVAIATFTLAVDRDRKNAQTGERETDWIDVVVWRNSAEFAAKYFAKGRTVVVKGRLQFREWTDKDGNKRRNAEVQAEDVYFGEFVKQEEGQKKPAPQVGQFEDIPDDGKCPF